MARKTGSRLRLRLRLRLAGSHARTLVTLGKHCEERATKMSLPALSRISSFSDNTSSPRIFNISKCHVMSRWQSFNTRYSVIVFPFTVTEPQKNANWTTKKRSGNCGKYSNPAFIHFWRFYKQLVLLYIIFTCFICEMLECASSIRARVASRFVLCLIDRWTADLLEVFSVDFIILNYPPRKEKLWKNIIFINSQYTGPSWISIICFPGKLSLYGGYTSTVYVPILPVIKLED